MSRSKKCFFISLLLLVSLPLCQIFAQDQAQTAPVPQTAPASDSAYKIENGDELEIKSIFNPEINATVVVRPDGKISMPLAPEMVATGKTPNQLAKDIADKYAAEYKQPEVAVIVKTFSGHRVFVGGEVRRPGTVSLAGALTVLQAISQAEGFTDAAKMGDVIVIRRDAQNQPKPIVVDLKKAMDGSDPTQDMNLKPYDIVYVPRSKIANFKGFFQTVIRTAVPW